MSLLNNEAVLIITMYILISSAKMEYSVVNLNRTSFVVSKSTDILLLMQRGHCVVGRANGQTLLLQKAILLPGQYSHFIVKAKGHVCLQGNE